MKNLGLMRGLAAVALIAIASTATFAAPPAATDIMFGSDQLLLQEDSAAISKRNFDKLDSMGAGGSGMLLAGVIDLDSALAGGETDTLKSHQLHQGIGTLVDPSTKLVAMADTDLGDQGIALGVWNKNASSAKIGGQSPKDMSADTTKIDLVAMSKDAAITKLDGAKLFGFAKGGETIFYDPAILRGGIRFLAAIDGKAICSWTTTDLAAAGSTVLGHTLATGISGWNGSSTAIAAPGCSNAAGQLDTPVG